MTFEKSSLNDPSAAEAWEDDADDWVPLTTQQGEEVATAVSSSNDTTTTTSTAMMQENLAQVLQAVDDLLLVTAVVGEGETESVSTGAESSSDNEAVAAVTTTTTTSSNRAQPNDSASTNKSRTTTIRESPLKIRRRLRAARLKLKQSVARPVADFSVTTTRRMVTGNRDTRVRDFVVLPHVVRVLDKYMFTFGILGMLLTQFILLEYPAWFRYYYCAVMLPLLSLRVVLFQRTKQQFFLLDYCYWVNGLGFFVSLCPTNTEYVSTEMLDILWQIFFVSSNGPLFFAMVAWNNSLVFHSIDKSTSTAVHMFPALLSLCERWRSNQALNATNAWLPLARHLGFPLLFYATWQTVYLWQTEVLLKDTLDADPELSTSLRYLTTAEKMSIHKQTLKLCRTCRIMRADETFFPATFKVKLIFVTLQAVMTAVTFIPVTWFYRYEWVHNAVVLAIFTFSVYNGARYYVQVFSRIYEKRYKNQQGDHAEEEYVDTSAVMTEHTKDLKKKE